MPEIHQRVWCKHIAKDRRVCALYLNHFGDHKENHMKSSWPDDFEDEIKVSYTALDGRVTKAYVGENSLRGVNVYTTDTVALKKTLDHEYVEI